MFVLFTVLLVLSITGLILGIFTPKTALWWENNPTRSRALMFYSVCTVIFFVLIGVIAPPPEPEANLKITGILTDKNTYLTQEPIVVKVKVENVGDIKGTGTLSIGGTSKDIALDPDEAITTILETKAPSTVGEDNLRVKLETKERISSKKFPVTTRRDNFGTRKQIKRQITETISVEDWYSSPLDDGTPRLIGENLIGPGFRIVGSPKEIRKVSYTRTHIEDVGIEDTFEKFLDVVVLISKIRSRIKNYADRIGAFDMKLQRKKRMIGPYLVQIATEGVGANYETVVNLILPEGENSGERWLDQPKIFYVYWSGADMVPAFPNRGKMKEYADATGISAQLRSMEGGYALEPYTDVKIRRHYWGSRERYYYCEIEILEGRFKDEIGWIPCKWTRQK